MWVLKESLPGVELGAAHPVGERPDVDESDDRFREQLVDEADDRGGGVAGCHGEEDAEGGDREQRQGVGGRREVIATGHLTWPQRLAAGDQLQILGHTGTVLSIEPLIGELEHRIVVQAVTD
jgi:hypothetical protein